MNLDNSALIAPFCPEKDDGDTFIYTEMLDRGKRKGNNGHRLLKTFYHRCREEFWEQLPTIQKLCDLSLVRACTRLSPRSFKQVGRDYTRVVVEAAMAENWAGLKSLYNHACGRVRVNEKLWLLDVDDMNHPELQDLVSELSFKSLLGAKIPSRKGVHLITRPFRVMSVSIPDGPHLVSAYVPSDIQVHKDNPTNLYIPEGAA